MTAAAIAGLVLRRLAALVVLLLLFSIAIYGLLDLAPGTAEESLAGAGSDRVSRETLERIREEHNLNDPFLERYGRWLGDAVQLKFGDSIRTQEPVIDGIAKRMGVSLFLALFGFLIAMAAGLALGIAAALRQGGALDRAIVALSVTGLSTPAFASGIALIYLFAVVLGWFPAYGDGVGFVDRLWHLTLPAIAVALTSMALVMKLTRAGMIEALRNDYVTFARARGVPKWRVVVLYALRNALIPVITAGGNILGYMFAGVVLVEVTFAIPGLGSWLVESVLVQDIPVVQGLVLTIAVIVVLINLITDLLYVAADPRIRFNRAPG